VKMMYKPLSIGYMELKVVLREVYRRRCLSVGKIIHQRLLEACLDFTAKGLRIVDAKVISQLHIAVKELAVKRRLSIVLEGEAKAEEIHTECLKYGIYRWAPRLRDWLASQTYVFWLGTIQMSSRGCICLDEELPHHQPGVSRGT
jgi:hypothetical protein